MHSDRNTDTFGKACDKDASWEQKKAYYRQSIARKEEVVSFLRQKNYHNLADNPHITVYTGIGSFAGPDVVEVRMAGRDDSASSPGYLSIRVPKPSFRLSRDKGQSKGIYQHFHYGTD